MLEIAVAYNRFKFLGDEFLTWLWFVIEQDLAVLKNADPDLTSFEIGSRMVVEKKYKKTVERITIKAEDAGLAEARMALKNGALVTELNLVYRSAQHKWQFSLKGESLNLSSLQTPKIAPPESPDEMEARVLEKLYKHFIKLRTSNRWNSREISLIKKWLNAER